MLLLILLLFLGILLTSTGWSIPKLKHSFAVATKREILSTVSLMCCIPLVLPQPVDAKALLYDTTGKPSIIEQSILEDQAYKKPIFNLPPKEQVFPSYYKGIWNVNYKYSSAEFTDKVQFQSLQRDPNVAGFRKYSVASMPDIGKDVVTTRKFIERSDGKIVEDVGYNLKAVVESCYSSSSVPKSSIVYNPSDNANRISFSYEDEGKSKSTGQIELFVNTRKAVEGEGEGSNSFYTLVNQRQSSVRRKSDVIDQSGGLKQAASQIIADYAIEYDLKLSSPPRQNDNDNDNDNVVSDRSKDKDLLIGTMRIFSYLQPQDSLYFSSPDQPVASFKYDVRMTRKSD